MDRIHDIDSKIWISNRPINLKELRSQRNKDEDLKDAFILKEEDKNYSEEELSLLDQSKQFFQYNDQHLVLQFLHNNADHRTLVHLQENEYTLKTYKIQLEHAQRLIIDRPYRVNYLVELKTTRREILMRHLALMERPQRNISSENAVSIQVPQDPDLVPLLVVQLWPQPNKNTKVKLEKEVIFRMDGSLTELRDQFKCQRDYGVPIDLSEDPQEAERIFRGEIFKSAMFLIGDTFYNDMRDPNNIDLSSDIMDWASKDILQRDDQGNIVKISRGVGPFKAARMEDSKFADLTSFKLGCPYLYLHQGDCEHLFTISDIRYVPNDEKFQRTKFPFVTATSIGKKVDLLRCFMCKNRPPHWYTRHNPRLPIDPFFFCESCFYSFNYDKNKQKLGQFQAYLYTSPFGIPDCAIMGD